MKNIFVFGLEPLESRYTAQWYEHIPELIRRRAGPDWLVANVPGEQRSTQVTPGAFLNFSDTNRWKSTQLVKFLTVFDEGLVTPDDIFLFTDFWNPVITQLRYMSDLLDQRWQFHGIAHAGAYDPTDILGYKMERPWPEHQERSWYYQYHKIYFATQSHRTMFLDNLEIPQADRGRAVLAGQPYEMLAPSLEHWVDNTDRQQQIIWPHRYNSDKQPEIVEALSTRFGVTITQKLRLSKQDYYAELGKHRVVFSCALHENLGISVSEGTLAGCIPVVPDRCSYGEMYLPCFKYPSYWTESFEQFQKHRPELESFISERLDNHTAYTVPLAEQRQILKSQFLNCDAMINTMLAHT